MFQPDALVFFKAKVMMLERAPVIYSHAPHNLLRDGGKLNVTVYRKPTHTGRYLDFWSHHSSNVKRGLVRCLYDRARSITTRQDNLQKEECHLTKVLKQNGYPSAFIHSSSLPSDHH